MMWFRSRCIWKGVLTICTSITISGTVFCFRLEWDKIEWERIGKDRATALANVFVLTCTNSRVLSSIVLGTIELETREQLHWLMSWKWIRAWKHWGKNSFMFMINQFLCSTGKALDHQWLYSIQISARIANSTNAMSDFVELECGGV